MRAPKFLNPNQLHRAEEIFNHPTPVTFIRCNLCKPPASYMTAHPSEYDKMLTHLASVHDLEREHT